MTNTQKNKIKLFKNEAIEKWVLDDTWELKKFEAYQDKDFGFVQLKIVVGLKGDEGTMAEIFGRKSAELFIGKRGKTNYYDTNLKRHSLDPNESLLTVAFPGMEILM